MIQWQQSSWGKHAVSVLVLPFNPFPFERLAFRRTHNSKMQFTYEILLYIYEQRK